MTDFDNNTHTNTKEGWISHKIHNLKTNPETEISTPKRRTQKPKSKDPNPNPSVKSKSPKKSPKIHNPEPPTNFNRRYKQKIHEP